jgi:hypothetical protein
MRPTSARRRHRPSSARGSPDQESRQTGLGVLFVVGMRLVFADSALGCRDAGILAYLF